MTWRPSIWFSGILMTYSLLPSSSTSVVTLSLFTEIPSGVVLSTFRRNWSSQNFPRLSVGSSPCRRIAFSTAPPTELSSAFSSYAKSKTREYELVGESICTAGRGFGLTS